MSRIPETNVQSVFEDPRRRSAFLPHYFPFANGRPAPPVGATAQNDRIVLEFLAAYYDLNCGYSRLLEVRARRDSPDRCAAERECLQAAEKALIVRDGLEDRYAPFGVIAQPIIKGGFTRDVKFSFGNADALGKPRSDEVTIIAQFPIPMPVGSKPEDFIVSVEVPQPYAPSPE